MEQHTSQAPSNRAQQSGHSYVPPKFEVISLDCEITAYAPDDGDTPLF